MRLHVIVIWGIIRLDVAEGDVERPSVRTLTAFQPHPYAIKRLIEFYFLIFIKVPLKVLRTIRPLKETFNNCLEFVLTKRDQNTIETIYYVM